MNSGTLSEKHTAIPQRFPRWLTKSFINGDGYGFVKESLAREGVYTVCQEARCPNINECFTAKKLTFMILGDVCTRSCSFCAAKKGDSKELPTSQGEGILKVIKTLGLNYVILTSVTRDDLNDGGLNYFLEILEKIKLFKKDIVVEALTPDFKGTSGAAERIVHSRLNVFAHNMETAERLYNEIRPGADYNVSLRLLKEVKALSKNGIVTKSGFMLGLGEREDEVIGLLRDLSKASVDIITMGQYLRPDKNCRPIAEFIAPEKFLQYKRAAEDLGIPVVNAGPFVRSSYNAEEGYKSVMTRK